MTSKWIGLNTRQLPSPSFLVDLNRLRSNCSQMKQRALDSNLKLRTHIKTHKTTEGALLQSTNKRSLVASTLAECEMLCKNEFEDILLAYPMAKHQMSRIARLREQLETFHIMLGHEVKNFFQLIDQHPPPQNKRWSFFLALDCGYGREGVHYDDKARIHAIANEIKARGDKVHLQGVYVHCGNTYDATHPDHVLEIRRLTAERLLSVKTLLNAKYNLDVVDAGIGSTPSCSHDLDDLGKMQGLTEVHPGNYTFYDAQQMMLGSCKKEEIAVSLMTRILEVHEERSELVIDTGFTALTKQGYEQLGRTHALIEGHPNWKLVKMSQELGIVSYDELGDMRVGDELFLIPYHSCATAACHPVYFVHENSVVVDIWHPCRGW